VEVAIISAAPESGFLSRAAATKYAIAAAPEPSDNFDFLFYAPRPLLKISTHTPGALLYQPCKSQMTLLYRNATLDFVTYKFLAGNTPMMGKSALSIFLMVSLVLLMLSLSSLDP
jgi:hypothetical protein